MNLLVSSAGVSWLTSGKRRGLGIHRCPNMQATEEGKKRGTSLLKQCFPDCGATKHDFRWDKVLLEELQDYINVC